MQAPTNPPIDLSRTSAAQRLFPGDGIMHAAVHTLDWGATPLGPVEDWCAELSAAASICLDSHFQIAIAWGPELAYVYNDAAIPIFGAKHPWALGRPVAEVWPEAWDTVGPMLQSVLDTGRATRSDDLLLLLERNGFIEECYFTFSYSPIRCQRANGNSTGGVFIAVLETSDRVLAARRQRALGDLAAAVALAEPDKPFGRLRDALAAHCADLPLANLWLADEHGLLQPAFWSSRCGLCDVPAPARARLRACAEQALGAGTVQVLAAGPLIKGIDGLAEEAPRELLCMPLPPAAPPGVLLLAANPRQPLDCGHRVFLDSVAGYVGHAAIVAGARAAERRRAEAVAELDNVLEATSDAFISVDRELRVLALNAAAVPPGGERAALVGRALAELVPSLAGSALEQALLAAAGGAHPPMVEHFDAHNGRWFSVRCYPSPHGVVLFGSEITSRKRAEHALLQAHAELELRVEERTAALRDAHRLLAAVFDRAPGGIAITDLDGKIVRANDAYAGLTGYPAAELPQRPAAERVDAADLARLRAGQARMVAGECEAFEVEMRYRRPDGRKLWVSNFVSMITDDAGRRYFIAIARDITERKRVEAERQVAQQELRTLYERLQTVRESERTALAREVHDQLGQILSAATIDIKLLEDDLRRGTAPLARAHILAELGSASATLERGIGLVREIATELRAPELDGQGLYAALAWHARDFERRTRIGCQVEFGATRPHPSRPAAAALLGIFLEAMTNVVRHAQASQVRVSLVRRGDWLVLRVRDDGIGIARGMLRAGGTLGLRGMRERAELVDGRLVAGPLAPHGTLVSVRVPLKNTKEKF